MNNDNPTAAMLAIGDELLSGRTKDRNIAHLADQLTLRGIDLKEVRIVSDDHDAIIEALNGLRERYRHVFTSGGIGPTHDDLTADAIAAAFGVPIDHDPRAMAILAGHYEKRGIEFTNARKRMARIPEGAELIANPVSAAPGFSIGNVHVMAGVPSIFEAMLDNVLPGIEGGRQLVSQTIACSFGEGDIGELLAGIQQRHDRVSIGSYPRFDGSTYSVQIVLRSVDGEAVEAAQKDVRAMLAELETARPGEGQSARTTE